MTVSSLGGLVLAGGNARRLGGGGKAAIEVGGVTLVARAVATLREAGCEPVVVVARADVALPPVDVAVVFDGDGPPGPLNAVRTGLAALTTGDAVVLACDLPLAGPLVARLARRPPGSTAVAIDPAGREQPLCARYVRAAALAAAEDAVAAGERRMSDLITRLQPTPDVEPAAGDELLNVNTPDDLAAAIRSLANEPCSGG